MDSSAKDQSVTSQEPAKQAAQISWLETVVPSSTLSTVSSMLKQLALSVVSPRKRSLDSIESYNDMDPICPVFADDDNPYGAGECIFTSPLVQRSILEFFEEVAQAPVEFRNPVFEPTTSVGGQAFSEQYDEEDDAALQPLQTPDGTPAQVALDSKKSDLENMKAALRDTPMDQSELKTARELLEKRIERAEKEVEDLTKEALAIGGLKAGEGEEARSNWKSVGGGPKIQFAGTMVDSELVKGAGLLETAEEELASLGSDD